MSETILKPDKNVPFPAELLAYSRQTSAIHRKQLEVKNWKGSWISRLIEKLIGEE